MKSALIDGKVGQVYLMKSALIDGKVGQVYLMEIV